jgi:hypothetical protein
MPDASQIRAQSFTPEERKRGARRGGRARAAALAPDQRQTIARAAARTRWGSRR